MNEEKRPRQYAAEAIELKTHKQRKAYIEKNVPLEWQELVIQHLKIWRANKQFRKGRI